MKKYILIVTAFMLCFLFQQCRNDDSENNDGESNNPHLSYLPASEQKTGDASAGLDYLLYGNYIGGGIPYDLFLQLGFTDNENLLNRTGPAAQLPPDFNYYEIDGMPMAGGITCLGCHSSKLNGEFVIGLGNSFADFTENQGLLFNVAEAFVANTYGYTSPEWGAFEPLLKGGKAVADKIITPFKGVNPAFALEQAATAHRNPEDLTWVDEPWYEVPDTPIASDTPPWWHLKKKNALYYCALGSGDYTKLLQQVSIVGIVDSTQAREMNNEFDDLLAFLNTIEPPQYPETINADLALQGKSIFNENCASCHGTYGDVETYPNLLVHIDEVGTDEAYAQSFREPAGFGEFMEASWYTQSPNSPATFTANLGYVAPPLDGIWASAPYLHNGSVPDLQSLLNSNERPTFWKRNFGDDSDLNFTRVGWNYTIENEAVDKSTYNTTLNGYGNQGHYYGDHLSTNERTALIEYLKGL